MPQQQRVPYFPLRLRIPTMPPTYSDLIAPTIPS